MAPILVQNTAGVITVLLELQTGGPALGLTFAAVTVSLRKATETVFNLITLDDTTFVERGEGVYDITLSSADTDVVGNFYVKVSGTVVITDLFPGYVTDVMPVPPASIPTPVGTSGLYGYILDASGVGVNDVPVVARVAATPTMSPDAGFAFSTKVTHTDANGYFFLTLVEGLTVAITIPAINYNRTLVVPIDNANLFSIP
jgi:hypothetical protein